MMLNIMPEVGNPVDFGFLEEEKECNFRKQYNDFVGHGHDH